MSARQSSSGRRAWRSNNAGDRAPSNHQGRSRGGRGGRHAGAGTGTGRSSSPTHTRTQAITIDISNPSVDEVLHLGLSYVHFDNQRCGRVSRGRNVHRFRCNFGIDPQSARAAIIDIQTQMKIDEPLRNFEVKYFFLTLHWLKTYNRYEVMEGTWNLHPETIGLKVKEYAKRIQALKHSKIKFGGFDKDEIFLLSLDGVHCRTFEVRKDPSTKWYSHKHHGPGVTYLLGIAIKTSRLIWIDGPYPASKHDITIYRTGGLKQLMKPGKRGIGDSAFSGEPNSISISHNEDSAEVRKYKGMVKARHETFNSRIKSFDILASIFRHDIALHQACFEAVCVLVQYDMENGHPLFDVQG